MKQNLYQIYRAISLIKIALLSVPPHGDTEWKDIEVNIPYPLWKHPFNPIHKVQYRILQALYKLMEILDAAGIDNTTDANVQEYAQTARWFYDESLHSCWLWWALMPPFFSQFDL